MYFMPTIFQDGRQMSGQLPVEGFRKRQSMCDGRDMWWA
jgi:hypothetical protein